MKKSFVSPILEKIAKRLGVTINIEPKYRYVGQIVLSDGRKRYFRNTNFDLNPLGASEVARDKSYASYFMGLMGYPVPRGQEFFTEHWCQIIGSRRNPEAAYRYARKLGLPVVVKPNSKSQGFGVAKVYNKREFMQAVRVLSRRENVFLVQEMILGNDYRIVVLDNRVISVYQRLPLSVVGDGKLTVNQLLRAKQDNFRKTGRDTIILFDDIRITNVLKRLGLSHRSVLKKGESVTLLPNANLSTGGDAIDVTEKTHPAWRQLAVKLTHDMGLRYCGVDVIVQSTLAFPPSSYVVLEINAAPGLDNYAAIGKKQYQIVEKMYEKVLRAMLKR